MRDRLMALINDVVHPCHAGALADYLISNDVIVPPCKVGQTVWFIQPRGKITETNVEKIVLKAKGIYIKLACNAMYETSCNSIGKTVFFTAEEAEHALKGEYNG